MEPFGVRFLEEEHFRWTMSKWRHERPRLAPVYDELASFIFELAYPKVFDTTLAEAALAGPVTVEDSLASLLGETTPTRERVRAGAGS